MLLIHVSNQEDKAAIREALHKCGETLSQKIWVSLKSNPQRKFRKGTLC